MKGEKDIIERALKLSEEIIGVISDKDCGADLNNFPTLEETLTGNRYGRELAENLSDEMYLRTRVDNLINASTNRKKLPAPTARMKKIKGLRRAIIWSGSVAAVTALAVIGIYFGRTDIVPQTVSVMPGSVKAVLTLADDSTIELSPASGMTYTQDDSRIEVCEEGLRYISCGQGGALKYNMLSVPRGGEYAARLSDGTRLWLNADTRIKFPVSFPGDERRVFITGEAYFAVTADHSRPFIVETNLGEIKVYGTEFNVRHYPDRDIVQATLVEGSIAFSYDGKREIMVDPGYRLSYGSDFTEPILDRVNVEDNVAWKNKQFRFDEQSLSEIMNTLARWYDVDVSFDSEHLRNIELSGILNRSEDVRTLLGLFEETSDVRFDVRGRSITVKEK